MKKHLLGCMLLACLALPSCTNKPDSAESSDRQAESSSSSSVHEHTYSSDYKHDGTYHWHESTCGHSVTSEKEKHSFETKVTAPTFEKKGYTTYTCKVCGYSYDGDETEELKHNYSEQWSHNTEKHWRTCTDAGYESLKSDEADHTFKEDVTAPTFEADGYTTYTCTVCGYSYTGNKTDKLTHNYSEQWNHDESNHWHDCVDKGYENLESDKASHTFSTTTTAPTFEEAGYTTYTCTVCGYSYDSDYVGKLTHAYSKDWSKDNASHWHACTDEGYETLTADKASHSYSKNVVPPTFESEGYTEYTCKVCGYYYTDSTTSKLTHNYSKEWTNDENDHWHACTDKGYDDLVSDKASHTFKDETFSPTFEEEGYTEHTCTVCGYSYKDSSTDKLEHSYSEYWSFSVTSHWHACTDEGYESLYSKKAYHSFNDDGICYVCGHSIGTSDNLKFELNEDGESYSVVGMGSETATNISIPSTYNGKPVTSIGVTGNAFYDCDIVSLSIPDSVTKIYGNAIIDCKKLTNITLSNNLTFYGSYAISSCDSLEYNEFKGAKYLGSFTNPYLVLIESVSKDITSVNINEDCKFIADLAFANCYNLTDISIPASVMSIASDAFKNCINLASITVDSNNKVYDSRNNCNALIETANNKLILGCKSTIIPDGITTIGKYAFCKCIGLTELTLPDSVTTIDQYAFLNCTGLTELTLPDSVTTINAGAFGACTGLTGQFVIPENVTSLGKSAFEKCGFTSIKLLCSLKKLQDWTFANCRNLKEITIAGKIKEINYEAFSGTDNVESIYFNGDIIEWLNTNTNHLPNFTDLYLLDDSGAVEHDGQKYTHVEGDLIIPNDSSLELSIGSRSFSGLKDITSVTIPANVTSIANGAFSYCTNLTSITVDEGNEKFDSRNNCNAIIDKKTNALIQGCKSTVIPEGVTSIGSYAFCGSEITSIVIPEGVTSIGSYAFVRCASLTDIAIPEGITTIEECTFTYCSSLTSIIIPKSLTSVGRVAFSGCNLQAVYFAGTYEEMTSKYILPGAFEVGWSKAYYYSESEPTSDGDHMHWHYVDGKPTPWETE